ncbi:MAG: hypothetical protein ACOYL6_18195 [Bacteriovoracaceae bacterium]
MMTTYVNATEVCEVSYSTATNKTEFECTKESDIPLSLKGANIKTIDLVKSMDQIGYGLKSQDSDRNGQPHFYSYIFVKH